MSYHTVYDAIAFKINTKICIDPATNWWFAAWRGFFQGFAVACPDGVLIHPFVGHFYGLLLTGLAADWNKFLLSLAQCGDEQHAQAN